MLLLLLVVFAAVFVHHYVAVDLCSDTTHHNNPPTYRRNIREHNLQKKVRHSNHYTPASFTHLQKKLPANLLQQRAPRDLDHRHHHDVRRPSLNGRVNRRTGTVAHPRPIAWSYVREFTVPVLQSNGVGWGYVEWMSLSVCLLQWIALGCPLVMRRRHPRLLASTQECDGARGADNALDNALGSSRSGLYSLYYRNCVNMFFCCTKCYYTT